MALVVRLKFSGFTPAPALQRVLEDDVATLGTTLPGATLLQVTLEALADPRHPFQVTVHVAERDTARTWLLRSATGSDAERALGAAFAAVRASLSSPPAPNVALPAFHAQAQQRLSHRQQALRGRTQEEDLPQRQQELASIGAALKRLSSRDYGRCVGCGQALGRQRLLAMPEAALCVPCSALGSLGR